MTQQLADVDGVINSYCLERYENSLMICLEDIGAESLTKILSQISFGLKENLNVVSKLSESYHAQLHKIVEHIDEYDFEDSVLVEIAEALHSALVDEQ